MERFGREMNFFAAEQQPAGVAVEREAIKPKGHLVPAQLYREDLNPDGDRSTEV